MAKMIHYQDDLFSLSVLVKSLDLILSTECDTDFFAAHIDRELEFLDKSLHSFISLLEQNTLLIERSEYLKLLQRTAQALASVLGRLESAGYPRAEAITGEGPRFAAVSASQKKLRDRLEELLNSSLNDQAETDLVSQDELSELLRE
jgi:hypothetical protein